VTAGVVKATEPTNCGQLGFHPGSAATLGEVCRVQGGEPITSCRIARKRPLCIEASTCAGGLWGIADTGQIRAEAEYLMLRFQEYGDPDGDGFLRRLTLYDQGRHARLLTRLAEDWQRERIHELRQRGVISSDPVARLPCMCSDHLRHALRVDVVLDRAIRTIGIDPASIHARDLLAVGEITASACWVPEATTLLVLALSRGWVGWGLRDRVVAAVQAMPPELRWPTSGSLFQQSTPTPVLELKTQRFGVEVSIQTVRDAQVAQRKIATRLRSLRENPTRRTVKGTLQALLLDR
jgi:hypothetical protein